MILIQEHTTEFNELVKKIEMITKFSCFDFGKVKNSHFHRFSRVACKIIFISYVLLNWSAIYHARAHAISLFLQIGTAGGILASLSIWYDLMFNGQEFYAIFYRIGKFEKQHSSAHFKEAFMKSAKGIQASAIFNFIRFSLVLFLSLIVQLLHKPVWTEYGKFNIKLPLKCYLPIVGPAKDWTTFGVNYVYQFVGAILSFLNFGSFMIIVSALVFFIVASMNVIIDLIENLTENVRNEEKTSYWNRKKFSEDIKRIIFVHVFVAK